MADADITTLGRDVALLLRQRLNARGDDLAELVKDVRRQLPRKLRSEALYLAEIQPMAAHPKLRKQVDTARAIKAHRALTGHLAPLGRAQRRVDLLLSMLGSLAFGVLVLTCVVVAVLVARGYL
ncbi:hypothetical protein [Roseicitreum antarcticum]|uniref:Uncharacterized protein n=1 Tax=Roseicitreum antarcticum TaxID=564137 RepID=A0A1H2UQC1_9RHOB|nr:hypothetical protein [Roseicitreum antarcticum]SDW58282.1 hypothetical protein SAMN04488238_102461 [Roseicitreum antarcticum]